MNKLVWQHSCTAYAGRTGKSKNHRAFLESKRFRAFEILGSDDGFCIHGNWNFDEFLDQANTR